jgi:glycosyltransferase involved in cell wall biosynthesis
MRKHILCAYFGVCWRAVVDFRLRSVQLMKILQICSASETGGGEVHLADLVRSLTERGHALYLVVRPKSPLQGLLSGLIISWHELPLRNSLDLQSIRGITRIIQENKIDIVHAHLGRDYLIAAIARRRAQRAKLVLTRHHYLPIKRNALYRWMLADATIIAVSSSVRDSLIECLQIEPEQVRVIPNWIDSARFQTIDRDAARAMFQVSAKLSVACIGRITPAKGQEEFIRAAGRIARIREDVEFLIVGEEYEGDRPFTKHLLDLARSLDISNRIRFLGYVPSIPELLAAVDVVVVPSWDEGFSLVTIEAMAARRAVLASDVGGIRDIIRDSATGLLFPPRDWAALASKLLWVLSDSPLRERLASQGQREVTCRFGREQIVDQIESLYLDLLLSGSCPPTP